MRPLHLLFALPIIFFTVKGNTHQWDIIHVKKPAPISFNVSLQPNMGQALLSVQKSDHLLDLARPNSSTTFFLCSLG